MDFTKLGNKLESTHRIRVILHKVSERKTRAGTQKLITFTKNTCRMRFLLYIETTCTRRGKKHQ